MRVVVQVTEDNNVVRGLTKDDFIITDNDLQQPIVSCDQEKEPLDLLLLLDISGSMRENIQEMSDRAREALGHLWPGDRIAIMTFALRTHLHFDWFDNHAEVGRQLRTATNDQDFVGYQTQINSAVIDAAKFLRQDTDAGRHSILMVTDNLGLNYQTSDEQTIDHLLKADAVFNAIVIGRGIRPGPPKAGDSRDYTPADVFKLADATGGEAVRAERAAEFFPQMVSRIRDRYTLAYHLPGNAVTGQLRRLSVELTPAARRLHPRAVVKARSGYYVHR